MTMKRAEKMQSLVACKVDLNPLAVLKARRSLSAGTNELATDIQACEQLQETCEEPERFDEAWDGA